jgi:hypothetical protein
LKNRYASIEELNRSWGERFTSFEQIAPFLPVTALARRKRLDFAHWYMDSMSEWCQQWAEWARAALPQAVIHQSSGGWGPVEIGTDYTHQARAMARLKGGIRLTNESDNYPQNFAITRMASSAARFYGAALGYEPGGFGSARGVVARLFNMITNGGEHLFYYHSNLYGNDQAIEAWLRHAPLLDRRAPPLVEVAAFYPDTSIKLDDEVIRYLWASAFLSRAEGMRSTVDFDYVSEPMIEDGALGALSRADFLVGSRYRKTRAGEDCTVGRAWRDRHLPGAPPRLAGNGRRRPLRIAPLARGRNRTRAGHFLFGRSRARRTLRALRARPVAGSGFLATACAPRAAHGKTPLGLLERARKRAAGAAELRQRPGHRSPF